MKYSEEELKVLRENYSEDFLNNYHRSLEKIDSLEEAMASRCIQCQ